MFETIRTTLIEWNQTTTDKRKLQHTYLLLVIVITFIAGIAALITGDQFKVLTYTLLVIVTTLTTNFVVWSLLKTTVLDKLPKSTRRKH